MNKMLRSILMISAGAGALALAGCGEEAEEATAGTLHLYNWADYLDPELIPLFEEEYGANVVLDTFESNEAMYAKLKAGAAGYDVVFPSSYQAYIMQQEGMLRELDHTKIPNIEHIDRDYVEKVGIDKEMQYSVPYLSGTTGIGYRASEVDNFEPTWAIYEREDLAGRMTLLDDMREALGAGLKYLGYSLNTRNAEEIREAGEVVKQWKQNIAKFAVDDAKSGLASGEFWVVQQYSGDIMQVIDANQDADVVYALPKEGFTVWEDDMVIPMSADNVDLAYAFINFMHDPEMARRNMEHNLYRTPNTAAYELTSEDIRNDEKIFIPDELLEKGEMIMPLGEDNQKYVEVWDSVKAAQ